MPAHRTGKQLPEKLNFSPKPTGGSLPSVSLRGPDSLSNPIEK